MVDTQKLANESLANSTFLGSGRNPIDSYLDHNVDVLDACNGLADKLSSICNYIESLRLSLHDLLRGCFSPTAVARADQKLESCRSILAVSSWGGLKKRKKKISHRESKTGYLLGSAQEEILEGSLIVTSQLCEILDASLSFRSIRATQMKSRVKPASSYSWLASLQELRNNVKKEHKNGVVWELQKTVWLTQELRRELRSRECCGDHQVMEIVGELERSSDELDNGIKVMEGKVKEVYSNLVCVRMCLLGKLSSMA